MVGILDYKTRVPSILGGAIDGSTPQLPAQRGGLFGMFQDDPGAITGGTASGRAPLTGAQKQALIFSGISDAIDTLQGRDGNTTEGLSQQYQQNYTKDKAEARRAAVNKALQDAYATGDMNKVRAAYIQAATTDPEAVGHIHAALTSLQPTDVAYGDGQNVYSKDPLTGALTPRLKIPEKNNPNAAFNADGTPNQAYQDYQVSLARARAKAQADFRAPPRAPKPNGVINLPHPGSQY